MKRRLLMGSLIAIAISVSTAAMASGEDCFPHCPRPEKVDVKLDPVLVEAHRGIGTESNVTASCNRSLLTTADELNETAKPIRDIVGYVRSPQGLVFKLVNDHVVKIPAWIGFVMDPLGSLKHKTIAEVRERARNAMIHQNPCGNVPTEAGLDANEAADAKYSI